MGTSSSKLLTIAAITITSHFDMVNGDCKEGNTADEAYCSQCDNDPDGCDERTPRCGWNGDRNIPNIQSCNNQHNQPQLREQSNIDINTQEWFVWLFSAQAHEVQVKSLSKYKLTSKTKSKSHDQKLENEEIQWDLFNQMCEYVKYDAKNNEFVCHQYSKFNVFTGKKNEPIWKISLKLNEAPATITKFTATKAIVYKQRKTSAKKSIIKKEIGGVNILIAPLFVPTNIKPPIIVIADKSDPFSVHLQLYGSLADSYRTNNDAFLRYHNLDYTVNYGVEIMTATEFASTVLKTWNTYNGLIIFHRNLPNKPYFINPDYLPIHIRNMELVFHQNNNKPVIPLTLWRFDKDQYKTGIKAIPPFKQPVKDAMEPIQVLVGDDFVPVPLTWIPKKTLVKKPKFKGDPREEALSTVFRISTLNKQDTKYGTYRYVLSDDETVELYIFAVTHDAKPLITELVAQYNAKKPDAIILEDDFQRAMKNILKMPFEVAKIDKKYAVTFKDDPQQLEQFKLYSFNNMVGGSEMLRSLTWVAGDSPATDIVLSDLPASFTDAARILFGNMGKKDTSITRSILYFGITVNVRNQLLAGVTNKRAKLGGSKKKYFLVIGAKHLGMDISEDFKWKYCYGVGLHQMFTNPQHLQKSILKFDANNYGINYALLPYVKSQVSVDSKVKPSGSIKTFAHENIWNKYDQHRAHVQSVNVVDNMDNNYIVVDYLLYLVVLSVVMCVCILFAVFGVCVGWLFSSFWFGIGMFERSCNDSKITN
eukprot:366545_1